MDSNAIKQRIDQLRSQINAHNHAYYVLNAPTISDRQFDFLLKELESLERDNPQFDDPYSPTHRVGSDLTKGFSQATHIHPMLSLANTYSIDEVNDWLTRINDDLGGSMPEIVGEMKFDGTSISLIYEHGRLVRAVTRGDGSKGDIVTDNILTIKSIPLYLQGDNYPDSFEIRGEIVLPWNAFDRLNAEREFNEEPLFANPRNAASGTLKLQNSAEVARRGLDAYFYHLIADNLPANNHFDNMMAASRWGFKVSNIMTTLRSVDQISQFIAHWDTARRELPVATDGLVFKVNNLNSRLNLGSTAKSPRWAIAYKFAAERALTRLRSISFEVGRSGVITPVANLDPVPLSGTIVRRASLHNADIIARLDIHNNDMVYVEKGGEIIPKITGVDTAGRLPGASPVQFVTTCPACGATLIRIPGEAASICPDKWTCPPQQIGRLEHFVGRRMMNIDGIGHETATALFRHNLVSDIADLYTLTVDSLATLPGFAIKSAERIIDGIRRSLSAPFERVIFALSIPYVGETVAKKIARHVKDMETLQSMTAEQLEQIDDVGPRIARAIVTFFSVPQNRDIVARLANAGVTMAIDTTGQPAGTILAGKSIVISGTFTRHSRDQYKEIIENNGGKNVSSISARTTFILAGDNMGPAKLQKARNLGIQIIDEPTFLRLVGLD